MVLSALDIAIVVFYLLATVLLGLYFRKRAEESSKSYLLGGKKLPWYMLGLSNASGMFDISGTMWLVTLLFVYGLKSIWIPWLWPVFNQIFLMMFLSMWLRRSNATTGAEWINTRFGYHKDAALSHTIVVIFAIVMGLGYLAYGFIGVGKFVEIFLPWEFLSPYIPFVIQPEYVPHLYGIVITLFAVFYTLLGGMLSIVWTDVLQYILMAISSIVIGVIAMNALAEHNMVVPDGWMSPLFGWNLELDWTDIIDEVNAKIASDGFGLFTIFFMMMIFKGILVSLAGPAPNYDMQKILSTRSPREAALMSGSVSVILMPLRYFMIGGFGILALIFYDQLDLIVAGKLDFEQVLPAAIRQFVPTGLLGILLAGLLAAFMSTFASTLNAAQAYLVNDIYLKYISPRTSRSKTKLANYASGLTMVGVSITLGFFLKDVNDVLQWIVSGLYGSYVAANVLKWYWWRFNGSGFFWGMVAGLIPALTFRFIFEGVLDLYTFPLMLLLSVAGCVLGTYSAPPVELETLKKFYRNVRPWGFWKPIHDLVIAEDQEFKKNEDFKRDMFNVVVGIIWQTALVAFPLYLILQKGIPTIITIAVIVLTSLVLKRTWYDNLPKNKTV